MASLVSGQRSNESMWELTLLEGIGVFAIFFALCCAGYFVYDRIAFALMERREKKRDPFDNC
jgi:hypothetical protein